MTINETVLEEAAIEWFKALGYEYFNGGEIAPETPGAERDGYPDVILRGRLTDAIGKLNGNIPPEALVDALKKVMVTQSSSFLKNNRDFHQMLTCGVDVEYMSPDGYIKGDKVKLIDFEDPVNNSWLVVNQFTVIEETHTRRPDMVVFVNGLPLAVIELKNAADEKTTIWNAFNQLQAYKEQIPSLFAYNELMIISDGLNARVGSITSDKERFVPWKTIEGDGLASLSVLQLEVLIKGIFDKNRFLDYVRHFVVFEDNGNRVYKKIAGYHQFHAVRKAVKETIKATGQKGDRRCGVVWHTQGSGKSLTMAFYAGKVVLSPTMENPTLVVITDRNDLDDQLFSTFGRCSELIRQNPVKINNRSELREKLKVASGGIFFTTIHKFMPDGDERAFPLLSDRRNIVVIADEAHRSQYDFIDGFARNMRDALPNASFIGFTGTPVELADKNTRAVFGDYISIYDIQQAVEDGATVPIYYESRLAKIGLNEEELPKLDSEFEEATEGEEQEKKEKLKTKWAAIEALVGTDKRINLVADDIVRHFLARLEVMSGKAMVVCMSRRICVEMYDAITKIRPDWHNKDDGKGEIKVVMTGSVGDPTEFGPHIRTKKAREDIANRFKDPQDPLKIVIVRDMWLTGFDVPCLHTMYVDKPMQGHGLMQAIARVNRVYKDKPGGLIVDYIGLAHYLKKALVNYTQSGAKGEPTLDQEKAVGILLEKHELCKEIFMGFDYSIFIFGTPTEKLGIIPSAQEHILQQEGVRDKFIKLVNDLSKAFALSVPNEEALRIRDDVEFFLTVKAALSKITVSERKNGDDLDFAIRQLVSKAVSSNEVIDIFRAAGLSKPEVSILSDEFLEEVRGMPHKNLAVELLKKLLNDEINALKKKFLVQGRSFSKMLEDSIRKYQNRAIETIQVIEELIALGKDMREARDRGQKTGLSEDELAFYDALEVNDSAVKVLGDENLKRIARELVETVRNNTKIDWTIREDVRARLRVMVKRILNRNGYPPDKQKAATETVLKQAETICHGWLNG
ncbi:MAG: type I restriction endonuclease subunit R [Firmicutes bacterium]|nr:type I restriction endonuclease subunit R [Bacillota bacterium]